MEEIKIEVDINLLYLQNILLDLENMVFDNDIVVLIKKLANLIDKKIYSNIDIDFENYALDNMATIKYKKLIKIVDIIFIS